jgi:hypothetical protein
VAASTLRCRYCRKPATTVIRATGGTGQLLTTSYAVCDRDPCAAKSNTATAGFAHRTAETIPEPATDTTPAGDTDQPSLF